MTDHVEACNPIDHFNNLDPLKIYFRRVGFNSEVADLIGDAFYPKYYKKGEYFLEEGKISSYLAWIESGVFQHYVLVDGEEKSTYIAIENSFLASLLSFLHQKPSLENIRCIQDGCVWIIIKSQLEDLVRDIPAFKDWYLHMLEYQIGCIEGSRFDFVLLSAEQRYEKMLQEEPHLLQKIPLQYLASILGISPRHLSRIRKKSSRNRF